jgi:hypothetical protein
MLYIPTTTDIDKMNRTDLVFEIAKKAHIDHYQKIITWPTDMIRTLMKWYDNQSKETDEIVKRFSRGEVDTIKAIDLREHRDLQMAHYQLVMGIDFAEEEESKTYTHTFVVKGKEYPLMSGMVKKYYHLIK